MTCLFLNTNQLASYVKVVKKLARNFLLMKRKHVITCSAKRILQNSSFVGCRSSNGQEGCDRALVLLVPESYRPVTGARVHLAALTCLQSLLVAWI